MSYDVSNIITINTNILPAGLGFANFSVAIWIMSKAEADAAVADVNDTAVLDSGDVIIISQTSELTDGLGIDPASIPETLKGAGKWLGGIPASNKLLVYITPDTAPATGAEMTALLDTLRNKTWFYWGFMDRSYMTDDNLVTASAAHADANTWMFVNCPNSAEVGDIRAKTSGNIAEVLNSSGYRHVYTLPHAPAPGTANPDDDADLYAGIALAKWYAAVNYQALKSTITGDGKKLAGVYAESLLTSAYENMKSQNCPFYTVVDLQGSTDPGRLINSKTHSSFGEWIDDVVNLDAFVNNLKVALYNVTQNQPTKLGQDAPGQATVIGTAEQICETYIENYYLGPRNYIDPDDGQEKFTRGYEILTKPEDIFDISESDRADRKSAPLRIRVFRRGAIQAVDVNVDVY